MINYGFYIGRFQPVHNGHLQLINDALLRVKKLILFIGSANSIRTKKNPFTFDERVDMISGCLKEVDKYRITYIALDDFSNEKDWINSVKITINNIAGANEKNIAIFGYCKDLSSSYLNWFPEYINMTIKESYFNNLSSTTIRNNYFYCAEIDTLNLHKYVVRWLQLFTETKWFYDFIL